jgi:hypothetical protein
MSFDTYSNLQTEIADASYRTDLTAKIPSFISLCETDMQVRCKLVEFEASATLSVVAGVATLPADFKGHRAAYLDGDQQRPLKYVTPDRFDLLANNSGIGSWFTVTGNTFKMAPQSDGDVVLTYHAKFTPLSDVATSNSILLNYPDAYYHGSLMQLGLYVKDDGMIATRKGLYEEALGRIRKDNQDRKYPGPLQVRAS